MGLGKMGAFIDIVAVTAAKDDEGFATTTDTVLASVRAHKETRQMRATGSKGAGAFMAATTLFRFRAIPALNITTAHAIRCGGERYTIVSVADMRGMYVEVLADIVTPKGGD